MRKSRICDDKSTSNAGQHAMTLLPMAPTSTKRNQMKVSFSRSKTQKRIASISKRAIRGSLNHSESLNNSNWRKPDEGDGKKFGKRCSCCKRSRKLFLVVIAQPIGFLLLFCTGMIFDSIMSMTTNDGQKVSNSSDFVRNIFHGDFEHTLNVISVVVRFITVIIAIVFQISAIMMQIAASQFTQDVFVVLVRDFKLIAPIMLWLSTALYSITLSFGVGEKFEAHGHVQLLLVLSTASLIMLPVYFGFLIQALNPNKIINQLLLRLMYAGGKNKSTNTCRRVKQLDHLSLNNIFHRQKKVVSLIDSISAICFKAMQRNDNYVAYHAVEALRKFATVYGETKQNWHNNWFKVPDRESPDTFSLSNQMIRQIERNKIWVEWKVMKQLHRLFRDGEKAMPDLCYVVAVNTKKISQAAVKRGDMATVDKILHFFNTYLRQTINGKNAKVMFSVLHEYRSAICTMLRYSVEGDEQYERFVTERILAGTRFLSYYLQVCSTSGLPFLISVIAGDIAEIVAYSSQMTCKCTGELLKDLLSIGHDFISPDDFNWDGIHKAQLKVACVLLDVGGRDELVDAIAQSMRVRSETALHEISEQMRNVTSKEFWEINDRQENLEYLTPGQKRQLDVFVTRVTHFRMLVPPKSQQYLSAQ